MQFLLGFILIVAVILIVISTPLLIIAYLIFRMQRNKDSKLKIYESNKDEN